MREASWTLNTLCTGLQDGYDRYNCVTVPDGQAHLTFAVHVCVDTVLVTYNRVQNIVQPKPSVREASRTQTRQLHKTAVRPAFTFPFKATTCDCRL